MFLFKWLLSETVVPKQMPELWCYSQIPKVEFHKSGLSLLLLEDEGRVFKMRRFLQLASDHQQPLQWVTRSWILSNLIWEFQKGQRIPITGTIKFHLLSIPNHIRNKEGHNLQMSSLYNAILNSPKLLRRAVNTREDTDINSNSDTEGLNNSRPM